MVSFFQRHSSALCLIRIQLSYFFFTQGQWKLFVENNERNSILTFPYDNDLDHSPHVNSSLVHPMGTTFLMAIVVRLQSKRDSFVESKGANSIAESSQLMETPKKTVIKSKYFDTSEKPQRQSARLLKSTNSNYGKKQPSFVSGYIDGQPLYTTVHQENVSRIEEHYFARESRI